jgi:outer membrane protein assembly factor BamB
VFVFFASGDLSALDFDGNILWTRRLGDEFGPLVLARNGAASVRRSREHVLVFASRESSSFLLAADPQLGKTDWMAERRSPASACNTPVVVRSWQREVVTLAAGGCLEGYSAHDGQRLWQLDGLPADLDTPPTPAELPRTGEGVVLLASPSPGSAACYKLLPAGRAPERVWRNPDAAAYRCPPLACDGVAYFVNREGLLLAADLQTGAELWRSALQGEPWASPVAAGERVYFFRRDGQCTVLASGRKLERLGLNSLDAGGDLHAAVPFDGGFLFRTPNRLIRAGSATPSSKPRYEWRATP